MTAQIFQDQPDFQSKGMQAAPVSRLADLHKRREQTQGQFFTPDWVCKAIWESLRPALHVIAAQETRFSLIDTSVGTGRLITHSPAEYTTYYGFDTDPRCIDYLTKSYNSSNEDLSYEFQVGALEDFTGSGFDLAIINPPFGLTLQSASMTPNRATRYGHYGPDSGALSHEYALAQALHIASEVIAILPLSADRFARDDDRLKMIIRLPDDAFLSEGANVRTGVYIYGTKPHDKPIAEHKVKDSDIWPQLPLTLSHDAGRQQKEHRAERFKFLAYDHHEKTIHLPVTGDNHVSIHHAGKKRIVLKFSCGATQAKVLNSLYKTRTQNFEKDDRRPDNMPFEGSGKLLLDTYISPETGTADLSPLEDQVRAAGGVPLVSSTLRNYAHKRARQLAISMTPFHRTAKTNANEIIELTPLKMSLLDPDNVDSPAITKKEIISAKNKGGEYEITHKDYKLTITHDQLIKRFRINDETTGGGDWQIIHKGRLDAFPQQAGQAYRKLQEAGIDWLWDWQRDSVAEMVLSPEGGLMAWQQGTGKARGAIALGLCGGKHNLIIVESGLLNEMLIEVKKLGLADNLWSVIERQGQPLAKLNIITKETMKRMIRPRCSLAATYRRRFHTIIIDEGGYLSNDQSMQSRAAADFCPKKMIIADGTPMRNYPRDMLPLVARAVGHGTHNQPYGLKNTAYFEPILAKTAKYSSRGIDVFRKNHVVTEWCTNEFADTMQNGAKREVPKINKLAEFRDWISPSIQRRLRKEPAIARHISCPPPNYATVNVPWDKDHLTHYLTVAQSFTNWYRTAKQHAFTNKKALNLVAVLARIEAVKIAANAPHMARNTDVKNPTYSPVTSKQRAVIDDLVKNHKAGIKTILYAENPETLNRLHLMLERQGVPAILFHGKVNIKKRNLDFDQDFRNGDVNIMLSSWVGQRGLNIGQGRAVYFYNRSWSYDTEIQAIDRTQRPDQTHSVDIRYYHLTGSIDDYMAQMSEWKGKACDAGLDFGEGVSQDAEFLHMDTILGRFCAELDLIANA